MALRFDPIDGCPVPRAISRQVRALKRDVPHAVLQSAYRGSDPGARAILKRFGKHIQAYLYWGFLRHLPGFNPANPPGRSTHELRSDAVAYRGPVGRPIRAWGCGLDWNDDAVDDLIQAAYRRGWVLFRPYASGSERHHVNFARAPKFRKVHR